MNRRPLRSRSLLSGSCAALLATAFAVPAARAAITALSFEKDVRPILKAHCFHCHGEDGTTKGDLDVRLKRFLEKGGETGPAIVPGNPHDSLILELLKDGEMPKKAKPLKPEEIATIEAWIAQGAKTLRPEPEKVAEADGITEEERQWWAFRPIARPAVPAGEANAVDAFVRAKLRDKGIAPSQEASRATLIRRAYFDLTGLPPTLAQVEAFVKDTRPGAWERLIDELLASPRYGERWGRHWLDVVGYADSEGYNDDDTPRESAWRYRDYVIKAFNADKPWDAFIQEQLAGDELIHYPRAGELSPDEIEKLTATGYLRMAPDGTGTRNMDQKLAQNSVITETVKIVSSSLLGMTVGCAECHDHRFDPILQKDFYRLRAVLEPGLNYAGWLEPRRREVSLQTAAEAAKIAEIDKQIKAHDAKYAAELDEFRAWTLERELANIPDAEREFARKAALDWWEGRKKNGQGKEGITPEQTKYLFDHPFLKVTNGESVLNLFIQRHKDKVAEFEKLVKDRKAERDSLVAQKPVVGTVRALTEIPTRPLPATKLFMRGNYLTPGPDVEPGDLTVLAHALPVDIAKKPDPKLKTSGRRLAFAQHLTSGKHPLVARVLVNRFWMHHFGRGLVGTAGDFGRQGERPTHPELLDWLASEFMENGWSLKRLHRLIMTSATYKQSSARRDEGERVDAANTLYWRANVRRLEAETIRDATLAVTGKLNVTPFGPPVGVMEDANAQIVVGGKEPSKDGQEFRRSIYVQQRRSSLPYQLAVFDEPQMEPNCEVRNCSTVAPQSLLLMNSAFVVDQSLLFAKRVLQEKGAGADSATLARHAWELAFGVAPSAADQTDSARYLDEQTAGLKGNDAREKALASLCQALLGSNQFLYAD